MVAMGAFGAFVLCAMVSGTLIAWTFDTASSWCFGWESIASGPLWWAIAVRGPLSLATHGSVLHLLLNAAAWASLARAREGELGTLRFAAYTALLGAAQLAALAAVGGAAAAWLGAGRGPSCAVGLSGVLFAWLAWACVAERGAAPARPLPLLGVAVPALVYPAAVLALVQLLYPGPASLAAHAAGAAVGAAAAALRLLPHYALDDWCDWLEASRALDRAAAHLGYVSRRDRGPLCVPHLPVLQSWGNALASVRPPLLPTAVPPSSSSSGIGGGGGGGAKLVPFTGSGHVLIAADPAGGALSQSHGGGGGGGGGVEGER